MLVSKVTKAVYDQMPDVLKEHYTVEDAAKPEGFYIIQTDEIKELRNAKAREVEARQAAERLLQTAQTDRATADAALAQFKKDNPDKAAAEAETQRRIAEATKAANDAAAASNAALAKAKEALKATLLDVTVKRIVTGLTSAEDQHLLEASIRGQIEVDVTGDEPKIIFKDAEGKALPAENEKTFREGIANDKKFAKIIVGSNATGGGAAGGAGQGGSGAGAGKKFADMNEQERTQLYRTNPTEFARLSAAHQQATKAAAASKPVLIR